MEDRLIEPDPHVTVDQAGEEVLLGDEAHWNDPEDWEEMDG